MSDTAGAKVLAIPPDIRITHVPPIKYRDLTEAEAREILADTAKLRIITNAHRCNHADDPAYVPRDAVEIAMCMKYAVGIRDVAHYVLEPVAHVSAPDLHGMVTAYGTNGSLCTGKAAAVAKQLRAWREP